MSDPTPEEEPFVLERTENPHPRMLAGALKARQAMRDSGRSATRTAAPGEATRPLAAHG